MPVHTGTYVRTRIPVLYLNCAYRYSYTVLVPVQEVQSAIYRYTWLVATVRVPQVLVLYDITARDITDVWWNRVKYKQTITRTRFLLHPTRFGHTDTQMRKLVSGTTNPFIFSFSSCYLGPIYDPPETFYRFSWLWVLQNSEWTVQYFLPFFII